MRFLNCRIHFYLFFIIAGNSINSTRTDPTNGSSPHNGRWGCQSGRCSLWSNEAQTEKPQQPPSQPPWAARPRGWWTRKCWRRPFRKRGPPWGRRPWRPQCSPGPPSSPTSTTSNTPFNNLSNGCRDLGRGSGCSLVRQHGGVAPLCQHVPPGFPSGFICTPVKYAITARFNWAWKLWGPAQFGREAGWGQTQRLG